ncbi:hypothetical protein Pcinc_018993, partial [Petrolisthes cinctipes]
MGFYDHETTTLAPDLQRSSRCGGEVAAAGRDSRRTPHRKTYSQPSNQPTLLTMSTYQAPSPGWFDEFRTAPFPTLYPELKTSVTQDVLYVGWGVAFLSAFTAFCLILPGVERSLKEQVKVFLRVTTFLAVGLIIMLCNFGQEWEVGHIETRTAYKAGSAEEIHAAIGVKLGLRSVNITLK